MAGGTKRLPRAVREQQMLDAAVRCSPSTAITRRRWTRSPPRPRSPSRCCTCTTAPRRICSARAWTASWPGSSKPCAPTSTSRCRPVTCCATPSCSFLAYIDANRASWIVLYTQATSSQAFAHTVREGRERIIELVARLLQCGHPKPGARHRLSDDGRSRWSVPARRWPTRVSSRRRRRRRRRRAADQPVLARTEGPVRRPSDAASGHRSTDDPSDRFEVRTAPGDRPAVQRPDLAGQVRVALAHVAQRQIPAVARPGRRRARRWRAGSPACRTSPSSCTASGSWPSILARTAAAQNIPCAIAVREAEQLGADRTGVDRVVVPADRGVAADLAGRDAQDRVGRRQLRLLRRLGGLGSSDRLVRCWCRKVVTWCQAGSLPTLTSVTTSTSRPLRCSRRFSACILTPTVSVTAIGRYWVMWFSTCTEPIAEKGKSNPVISDITVGNVSANG